MRFTAKITENSPIDKLWRAMHRIGGDLLHVHFQLKGQDFVTEELSADEASRLRYHPSVTLEVFNILPQADVKVEVTAEVAPADIPTSESSTQAKKKPEKPATIPK